MNMSFPETGHISQGQTGVTLIGAVLKAEESL